MRKIFSKIAGLMLGLSLAAGVGVAIGAKKAEHVHAATSSYVITFKDCGGSSDGTSKKTAIADLISSGSEYISSLGTTDNLYQAKSGYGIKGGGGSALGKIVINWNSADYPVKPTSIVAKIAIFNNSKDLANGAVFGYNTSSPSTAAKSGGVTLTDYTISLDGNTSLTSLAVAGKQASNARFYLERITINYQDGEESCTHNWVAGTVHAPTCTEAGYTEYECSECGETKQDDVTAALGHDYGAWTVVTPASCLTAGEERRVCSHDSSHIETRPIAALGHSYVDGICERCGAEEPSTTTVPYVFSEHYSADTVIEDIDIAIDANITIRFVKRSGGTDTKYFAGSSNHVRWYGGGTLSVSSSAGNIQSIDIVFSGQHSNAVTADVGSYADISSASGTGTWVGNSDTVVFSQAGTSGHGKISSLSVTYDNGGTPAVTYTITYLANAADAQGSMSPTTASSPQVAACSFTREGYEFARWNTQADGEGDNYTVGTSVSEDLTLYAIWQEYVAPIEGNVSMEGVTSASAVTVNGHPALKCGAGSTAGAMKLVLNNAGISKIKVYVAGWKGDTSKTINIETTGCTMTEDSISITEDSAITGSASSFTLDGAETTYRFTFEISDATAGAEITLTAAQASKNRFIVWGATDLFAESFADEFSSNLTCDASGEDGPSFTSGHDWTTMNSFYNGLDAEEQGKLHDATFTVVGSGSSTVVTATGETSQSVAEAIARYDYIIAKYGTSEYTNFIGRTVNKMAPARMIGETISSSSSTIIIVVVALTSITSIGVLLVIKRKRSLVK